MIMTTKYPATVAPAFPGLATVLGFQEDGAGGGFWLVNLIRDIPKHPAGSTVAVATVERFLGLGEQAVSDMQSIS